jgi:hypothetical protein
MDDAIAQRPREQIGIAILKWGNHIAGGARRKMMDRPGGGGGADPRRVTTDCAKD